MEIHSQYVVNAKRSRFKNNNLFNVTVLNEIDIACVAIAGTESDLMEGM
jgi:hypothetical protein